MDKTHEKLGIRAVLPEPLLQRHLEEYYRAEYSTRGGKSSDDLLEIEYRRIVYQAACACGWVFDPEGAPLKPEHAGDQLPAAITWIYGIIQNELVGATAVPGE